MFDVPEWSYDPDHNRLPYLPVETLPARGEWTCVLTCMHLYKVHTHWLAHRNLPCLGDGCGACEAEKPRRQEAFGSVIRRSDHKHIIVRLTPRVVDELLRSVGPDQIVRGTVFTLKRRGRDKWGGVSATVETAIVTPGQLPVSPDLRLHLSRLWRIDGWEPALGLEHYAEQMIRLSQQNTPDGDGGELRNAS